MNLFATVMAAGKNFKNQSNQSNGGESNVEFRRVGPPETLPGRENHHSQGVSHSASTRARRPGA